ncbi:MAG: tetratricopeptide repeat protein [Rhodospirillales bacterium]|nr:tetratricopeptide repeat protein [Rhodospirillales bacterium]
MRFVFSFVGLIALSCSVLVVGIARAYVPTACMANNWNAASVKEFVGSSDIEELESLVQYGVVRLYGLDGKTSNLQEAISTFKSAAESGYAPAQNILGTFNVAGWGLDQSSYDNAKGYFFLAADQNYAPAQNNLGTMYWNALGTEKDRERALVLFESASKENYAPALYNLAWSHKNSERSAADNNLMLEWLIAADLKNYAPASLDLGMHYAAGIGVKKDYEEAVRYFKKAANVGDPWAQYNLGHMYALGWGVSQDFVNAYVWFDLSDKGGVDDGGKEKGIIRSYMTDEQVAAAETLRESMSMPLWNELVVPIIDDMLPYAGYWLISSAPKLLSSRAICSDLGTIVDMNPWITNFKWSVGE